MVLNGVTFLGPETTDSHLLEDLPRPLRSLLTRVNGFIAYQGALHVRGVCDLPAWHSIHAVWRGPHALHRHLSEVFPDDVPFAQDYRGDQFLLRDERVHKLTLGDGQVTDLGLELEQFLGATRCDPVDFLDMEPLRRFYAEGGILRPGRILPDEDPVPRVLTPGRWRRTAPALPALVDRVRRLERRAAC